jgi:hypothetical protein
MPDLCYYAFVIAVFAVIANVYEQTQTMTLRVYHGPPWKGVTVSYNTIDMFGRVDSHMSYDYNYIFNDNEKPIDSNLCFDNIPNWCNAMIELSGKPVYLMTDTYYRGNDNLPKVMACQRKMFRVSGIPYV